MTKHEELVRRISEEMAASDWDKYYSPEPGEYWEEFRDQPDNIKDKWVQDTILHARIAVKHMANVHETGFRTGMKYANTGKGETRAKDLLNKGLINEEEYGECLIAPKIKRSDTGTRTEE